MCGIIGSFSRAEPFTSSDHQRLQSVLDGIAYRGPDGAQLWHSTRCLLGHRRLSIIDLSPAGAQPFEIANLGLVITFNGEIYNFRELRATLAACGYAFRSHSDTEVILYAYDHYGMDFLGHLQGMFAFCLFDRKRQVAVLARDPAGEKPLYYYEDSTKLIFASEIKAFHAFPDVDLAIDVESVRAFFALQYIPGPHTIYSRVRKLPAGHAIKLDLDPWSIQQVQFWSLEQDTVDPARPEEIDALLMESVKYRLIADVEVGLLLSGGIDSALLAAYAHQNGARLRVFTARFDEADLDELKYARQVADYFGLEQIVVTGGQITPELFERVIFHADELLGDPACVPTFLLSQEVSRHVKVVLSGEGADELFWGYDTYRYERLWHRFAWMNGLLSHLPIAEEWVARAETNRRVSSAANRLGKVLSAHHDLGAARWTTVFADRTLDHLVPLNGNQPDVRDLRKIEQCIRDLGRSMDSLRASLAGDLLYWLPDDLLMKVDRMTMAHSVEARAPFLAPELIGRALALPDEFKMQGNQGKLILRRLLEKYIPGEIGHSLAWRKKHGFEVPTSAWLRNELREAVADRLSTAKLATSGLLDAAFARKVTDAFYASPGDSPLKRKLWLLLCFQTWYELHEKGFGFR